MYFSWNITRCYFYEALLHTFMEACIIIETSLLGKYVKTCVQKKIYASVFLPEKCNLKMRKSWFCKIRTLNLAPAKHNIAKSQPHSPFAFYALWWKWGNLRKHTQGKKTVWFQENFAQIILYINNIGMKWYWIIR